MSGAGGVKPRHVDEREDEDGPTIVTSEASGVESSRAQEEANNGRPG